ncbi:hypothetical protein PVAP13_9NG073400 [Panicum virgatum]|uniref:Uncharacterized protein n=1 Tax=Panicum virgatum TaxID=38727 RepID=A0A8T0MHZ2_PANVG|nr:hypothetical protein PVAP13_9NG073400 [Panicum virgatum]
MDLPVLPRSKTASTASHSAPATVAADTLKNVRPRDGCCSHARHSTEAPIPAPFLRRPALGAAALTPGPRSSGPRAAAPRSPPSHWTPPRRCLVAAQRAPLAGGSGPVATTSPSPRALPRRASQASSLGVVALHRGSRGGGILAYHTVAARVS